MDRDTDYIELVEQAWLGERESLDSLAQRVRGRLYTYVYRITLREDVSQDIVQESMLEMFNKLNELRRADRFWPWLRGIAFNKIRHYYKKERRHRTFSLSSFGDGDWLQGKQENREATGLDSLIGDELKQIVFNAMRHLKPKHRAVLTMRCYEEMRYSQIAQLMGSSELNTRVLFYRAKEALHKQLSRKGFGKEFLLSALALFGKMTAPSEAAATSGTVTVATTNVGITATLVGAASSKTTLVTLATAGVLATGAVLAPSLVDKAVAWTDKTVNALQQTPGAVVQVSREHNEYWYYYPEKADGPVMTRLMKQQPQARSYYCQRLENDHANYYFDKFTNIIHINNHRMWQSDMSVRRLPTDSPNLTGFLSKLEGGAQSEVEYVSSERSGLLVIVEPDEGFGRSQVAQHYNVLDEEYFRYDWPRGAKIADNRDAMHKRGWTYFRVKGQVNGEAVSGTGRIPFVYAASKKHHPWLKLQVAERLKITDGGAGAHIYDAESRSLTPYPLGSFFKGFARPWMGLHTIDTIRRDAAEQQLWFETKYSPGSSEAEVIISCEQDKIVYTVDMDRDVIEKIVFLRSRESDWETKAELRFSYLDDVGQVGNEFAEPRERDYAQPQRRALGMLWLVRLAEDGLD